MSYDVTTNLVTALVTTFAVIIIGYIMGRVKVLTTDARKLIGNLIVKLILPCLVMQAMATLDLKSLLWHLIAGVALAKVAVMLIVAFATMLVSRFSYTSMACGGLRSILSVQSNDFALGLPIMSALYPPELTQYLYLFAPIVFFIVYPFAFCLLEYGTRKTKQRTGSDPKPSGSSRSFFGKILFAVFVNPVVIATIAGLVLNFAFKQNLPRVINEPLKLVGSAFNTLALLNLGANMVGKANQLKGRTLLKAVLLVLAKSILLALLASVFVNLLGDATLTLKMDRDGDGDDDDQSVYRTYKLSLFAFIYGTFPPAPGALPFAQTYGVDISLAAATLLIGTTVAAPLMFVSAKMAVITITDVRSTSLVNLIETASLNLSYISIGFAALFFLLFLMNKRYTSSTDKMILFVAAMSAGLAICQSTCVYDFSGASAAVQFSFLLFFSFGHRIAILLFGIHMVYRRSKQSVFSRGKQLILLALLWSVLSVGIVWVLGDVSEYVDATSGPDQCYHDDEIAHFYMVVVITAVGLLGMAYAVVLLGRQLGRTPDRSRRDPLNTGNSDSFMSRHASEGKDGSTSGGRDGDLVVNYGDSAGERTHLLSGSVNVDSTSHHRTRTSTSSSYGLPDTLTLSEPQSFLLHAEAYVHPEEGSLFSLRVISYLVCCTLSCALGLVISLWKLMHITDNGIYYEFLFADDFLLHSQNSILFLCVGTSSALYRPFQHVLEALKKKVRRVLYHAEDMQEFTHREDEIQHILNRAELSEVLCAARDALVATRTHRFRKYKGVLVGSELVSFFVDRGEVLNVDEAILIGRSLVANGVLTHVTQEHHFRNEKFFYYWHQDRFEAVYPHLYQQDGQGM